MSDPENFLARWARRKREVEAREAEEPQAPAAGDTSGPPLGEASAEAANTEGTGKTVPESDTFDPSNLPPLESITAETDISGYFARGVPADLVRAALRRVWTSDPTIRDFVGLSENAWDFNAPETIPGFGPITASDDVAGMMRQLTGEAREAIEQTGSEPSGVPPPQVSEVPENLPNRPNTRLAHARVENAESVPPPDREQGEIGASPDAKEQAVAVAQATEPVSAGPNRLRGHGSALPK